MADDVQRHTGSTVRRPAVKRFSATSFAVTDGLLGAARRRRTGLVVRRRFESPADESIASSCGPIVIGGQGGN